MKPYKKPTLEEIKNRLTPEAFCVTQEGGTEAPFKNAFWDNHRLGIYVDVVSGEPLFSSIDKFDSGTGWPSFSQPIDPIGVIQKEDRSIPFMARTEIRSREGESHLGHVFEDGPAPTGLRYCVNSASLRFIPFEQLEKEGYEKYVRLFLTPNGLTRTQFAQGLLPKTEMAAFAAGCFWGVEEEFRNKEGVIATAVGFMGGHTQKPSYEQVCRENTGHAEAVVVEYDPKIISYQDLLNLFWNLHDPTTLNRQGPDVGDQYRSAIFYFSPEQKAIATASREFLGKSGTVARPIVTEVVPAAEFTKAEEYHQQYVAKG